MARIQLGDWGGRLPASPGMGNAPPAAAFVQPGLNDMGQALDKVAGAATAEVVTERKQLAAEDRAAAKQAERDMLAEQRQAERDYKAQQREQRSVAALRSTTDYGNDVADLHDQVRVGLQTGQVAPDKALQDFDNQANKLREKYASTIAPDVSEQARIHMDNTFRDTRRKLSVDLENHRRQQMVADFGATREGLERRAIRDPQGAQAAYEVAATSVLGNAGFTADKIAADVQNFKERTTFNYVAGQINAATNDPRALDGLQKTLADTTKLDVLDPDKRRILLNQVEGRQETLRMRAEREQEKRLNQLGREMDSISRLSLQGIQPTPDRLAALQAGVRGTPYAAEFKSYLDGLNDQRQFAQLPPDKMRAKIEADIATVAKNGGNEADRMRIQRRTQAYELASQQLTQDPLAYNARTTGSPIPPIDMAKPDTIPAALQERASILLPLNQSHGANVGLLRPDEALQARQMLRSMPAERRAGFLNMIYGSVGSGPVYNATLAQLAPDSPVTAMAGQLLSKGDVKQSHWLSSDTSIVAKDVATRMLRGEDLLNPPSTAKAEDGKTRGFQIGKEQDFAMQFNNAAGKAFPGAESQRIRDTYYQAAKAVYADLSVDAGDRSGIVDGSRVKKAFEMVTGGGVVKFGDSAVIPPFGMTGDALKSRVYQQFSAAVDAGQTNVPATYIRNASLYQIGDGRFLVQQGGRFLPDEKTGSPLVVDVTGNPPPASAAPTNRPATLGRR